MLSPPNISLKDIDFKEEVVKISIHDKLSKKMIEQLLSDSNFLRDQYLCDYSLLVGIHELDLNNFVELEEFNAQIMAYEILEKPNENKFKSFFQVNIIVSIYLDK